MYRDILVPLDGTTFAERALAHALPIARRSGAKLHLFLVHEPIARYAVEISPTRLIDRWEDRQRDREGRYLERCALAVRGAGVDAVAESAEGDAAEQVADRATGGEGAAGGADLVVMATHGRRGLDRLWAGSVADDVMRRVHPPLILVPPTLEEAGRPDPRTEPGGGLPAMGSVAAPGTGGEHAPTHVVAATDGSPAAAAAVEHAARLAGLFGARLTVVRVVTAHAAPVSPYIPHAAELNQEELAQRDAEASDFLARVTASLDLPVEGRVVHAGHAARGILATCAEVGGDLLAVGTRRRGRFVRAVLGSVADAVVRGSEVPVLVAHAPHDGGRRQSFRTSPS